MNRSSINLNALSEVMGWVGDVPIIAAWEQSPGLLFIVCACGERHYYRQTGGLLLCRCKKGMFPKGVYLRKAEVKNPYG